MHVCVVVRGFLGGGNDDIGAHEGRRHLVSGYLHRSEGPCRDQGRGVGRQEGEESGV